MPIPTPSHRLTLLRRFEKQVAPLERYGVDFLGLCEDTRAEILYLEKRGKVVRTEKGKERNRDGREDHGSEGFAKFGAGVGDEKSLSGGGGEAGYERSRKEVRRAKTLHHHPKNNQSRSSKWYDFLGRRSQHTTRSTSPALGPIRTLSPRPVARASHSPAPLPTRMIPKDRPRRRLSKVGRGGRDGGGKAAMGGAGQSGADAPQFHPNYNGSWESLPNPSSPSVRAHQNTAYTHPNHASEARTTRASPHVVFEDGVQGDKQVGNKSETDSSVITYNDGTEKGRAKRIRMLERWNRVREARQ